PAFVGRNYDGRRGPADRLLVSPQADVQARVRAERPPVDRMDARLGTVRLDRHLGADNRGGLPDPQSRGCAARRAAVVPARLRRARNRTQPERNPMKRSFLLMPLIALAVIALAACGSSANSPTGPSLGSGAHTQQSASLGSLAAARAAVA